MNLVIRMAAGICLLPLMGGASLLAQQPLPQADVDAGPPVVETNPAVRVALELPRETPGDYFRAVIWLVDLGRPELAKPILEELSKLQLSDVQRAALVDEFGSRDMLLLARTKELAPEGAAFTNSCMAAAAAAANNPERIAALVAQLTDPSPEIRQMARSDLAATGRHGVLATLAALARETDRDRRMMLLTAAAQMRPLVIGPLLAMLDSDNAALRADVAELLRHLQVPQAAPLIAEDPTVAERALTAAIEQIVRGTPPFAVDEHNRIELWKWCDESKLIVAHVSADDASVIWMSRLARRRAQLRPENREYVRQSLLLGLEAASLSEQAFETGGQPYCEPAESESLVGKLPSTDTRLLNGILADALRAKYAHAAVAAASELGRRREPQVVYSADAQPSPLANALGSANRRVRFAALAAIWRLNPDSPYPGSSRVPEAAAWFAGARGERQALVAMPTLEGSTNIAGMLAAHEIHAEATNNGQDAIDLAREMADLEMIFLDMDILAPGIREVLYELRIHPTTAEIPIALMAAEGRLEAARQLAAEHDRVVAVSRPHSPNVLAGYVESLAEMAGPRPVSPVERVAQASAASQWLDEFAATRRFYTIHRTLLPGASAAASPAPLPTP
jgi:CheY-like chemotaxis protein